MNLYEFSNINFLESRYEKRGFDHVNRLWKYAINQVSYLSINNYKFDDSTKILRKVVFVSLNVIYGQHSELGISKLCKALDKLFEFEGIRFDPEVRRRVLATSQIESKLTRRLPFMIHVGENI